MKTAILVDGGFYRHRAQAKLGDQTAKGRADELFRYCLRHLKDGHNPQESDLYRIFYYDCFPTTKKIYHPLLKQQIDFSKTDLYKWTNEFFEELKRKRKFALRMGVLADAQAHYTIKYDVVKKMCNGSVKFEELTEKDFELSMEQKGVDMKIGIDITSLSFKRQVDQIVLISGDSDFVPAAKLARREGVDFVLDPLGATVKPNLFEHIDGLRSCDNRFTHNIIT